MAQQSTAGLAMFFKLGFRNLFRNKRRTLLTALVIGISLAALIISNGMMHGITKNMVDSVTQSVVGEGKITHPDFRSSLKAEYVLTDVAALEARLAADPRVKAFSTRTLSFGMLAAPKGMSNVLVYGIEPSHEAKLSRLAGQIVAGSFVADEKALVIGTRLQQKLKVRLGDKVVMTMTAVGTGEIAQELMRITGVFQTGAKQLDEKAVYLHIHKARSLLALTDRAHEIALAFHDRNSVEQLGHPFWQQYSQSDQIAESWRKIMASFVAMMKAGQQSQGLVALILMILVGITITNTLFMALHERMFEFAVLQALGTRSSEIIVMILAEAFYLALFSVGIGIIVAGAAGAPLYLWGLDYQGVEFSDVTLVEPITYQPSVYQFTVLPLAAVIFTVAVALYPALYASRLKTAEALKRSF